MRELPSPRDPSNVEHYRWGGVSDGWKLLNRPDLSVVYERVPPGGAEVRHLHTYARQFFFVLEGLATLEFGAGKVRLEQGQGVEVPQGEPHRFVNEGENDVLFLVISAPSTQGDRLNLPERG